MLGRVILAMAHDDRRDRALGEFAKDDVAPRQQMDGRRDDANAILGSH
jgi:hypothetical protein